MGGDGTLTNLIAIIILHYAHISNHYIVHLKLNVIWQLHLNKMGRSENVWMHYSNNCRTQDL